MKLNTKTRELVKEGTILKDDINTFTVTTVIELNRGKLITVRTADNRTIYAMPLTTYYGCEIVLR